MDTEAGGGFESLLHSQRAGYFHESRHSISSSLLTRKALFLIVVSERKYLMEKSYVNRERAEEQSALESSS